MSMLLGFASLLMLPAAPQNAANTATKPTYKVVKYQQLCEAIKLHSGKVIVVDVWAEW